MQVSELGRVREYLAREGYDGLLISRVDNYQWLVGPGRRNFVLQNTETGVGSLLITDREVMLLADSIDGQRLRDEEFFAADADLAGQVSLHTCPWYQDSNAFMRELLQDRQIVSDTGVFETKNVQVDLVDLRSLLSTSERAAYRQIGLECAQAVEATCLAARPGMSEQEIALNLKQACLALGINANCVLVGADDRIFRYRHPMPTDYKVKNLLMLVLGGEKYGLNVSLTRFVAFGQPEDEYLTKFKLTQEIFAGMQDLTRPGRSYQEFFAQVQGLYTKAGYKNEWQKHHQGGPTGYACRESIVSPNSSGEIKLNQAFAWNPTITGCKCEETSLLTADGLEILTRTNSWPVTSFSYGDRTYTAADLLVQV